MAAAAARIPRRADPLAGFIIGKKQVYLPNFTVTLLRTPFLPPTFATFIVPLNLTKIDIRDYIYHAYGVKAIRVRSFVQQQKIRPNKPNFKNKHARKWFRPRSIKKMTIEMDKPFVWPDEPEDFSPWDKDTFDKVRKVQEAERDKTKPERDETTDRLSPHKETIAEQAQRLLTGKERWKPVWEDVGEPIEVEKDL